MANEKAAPPVQQDIEHGAVDQAAKAIRELQRGASTHERVKALLAPLSHKQLSIVAFATRTTVRTLEDLKSS